MAHASIVAALVLTCSAGCTDEALDRESQEAATVRATPADDVCRVVESDMPLPLEVRETSGMARSGHDPTLFWTHNDAGGRPEIFAVRSSGELIGRVPVEGVEMIDWEAISSAPCSEKSCLYVGDIGDNEEERDRITVYRLVEPDPNASGSDAVDVLHARFPDGPRDAEALFVDRSGTLYVVNKGDRDDIALYRWPATDGSAATVTLEHVRTLFPEPENNRDRVTDASTTPDGTWVGIRTYRRLYLYRSADLLGSGDPEPIVVDLSSLSEAQGEALVLSDDGEVWLSSEAENRREGPRWARLQCTFTE